MRCSGYFAFSFDTTFIVSFSPFSLRTTKDLPRASGGTSSSFGNLSALRTLRVRALRLPASRAMERAFRFRTRLNAPAMSLRNSSRPAARVTVPGGTGSPSTSDGETGRPAPREADDEQDDEHEEGSQDDRGGNDKQDVVPDPSLHADARG